ncbi:hypothetical protein R3P38DRAFT_2502174 [Favolaschia claudopus]|uniref:Stealth protein CR3 conserved region 3 domain-containing protein n=1 Tax=Favolaschia claudopus TaxID=2862362 RepID=A0AAW0DNZ2_9AGAR
MATHSLPLYQPLGGGGKHSLISSLRWRSYFFNPARCTAILLIVALSLTSIGFLSVTLQGPWGSGNLIPKLFGSKHSATPSPDLNESDPDYSDIDSDLGDADLYDQLIPQPEIIGKTVYHPFLPPHPSQALADQTIRPITAHSTISNACLDKWVSTGLWQEPCRHSMVQDSTIDLVYIWVNGSDSLHQKSRQTLLDSMPKYRTKDARFREHDELRYSLRAARNATASWPNSTWHIITADVPDPRRPKSILDRRDDLQQSSDRRLGLVPQWLDIECAFYGCAETGSAPIRLQHDTQLFRLTGRPNSNLQAYDAENWLKKVIPSFNSHAIESQLPNLDPQLVSDNIVALNDDQFMLLPLPPSAFHTTLYGPVFRLDPGLLVDGDASGRADGGGEWRSLGWSASLLNERFGNRRRPYMHHNARALSLPLMHEVSLAFGEQFAATPLSQFRGSHRLSENDKPEFEVNTIFISTHFIIERHREALLWSWVIGKWGWSASSASHRAKGMMLIDRETKQLMWEELCGGNGEREFSRDSLLFKKTAERRNGEDVEVNMLMAGLQPPQVEDKKAMGDTTYSWVSMDGFSSGFHDLPSRVEVSRKCIGENAELAWDVFLRLLKGDTACGDNVIAALMHSSRSGLAVFLPAPSNFPASFTADPLILPLELPSQLPPLPQNPRVFAVRLLMRYAYVLGDSPTVFMGMSSPRQTEMMLNNTDLMKETALLCINDDLPMGTNVREADNVLRRWFERRWPQKLACEV